MDIRARINARKIAVSYLYQHCFFCSVIKKDQIVTDTLFADYVFKTDNEKFDVAREALIEKIRTHEFLANEEDVKEFVDMFFDNWTEADIDYDYLIPVVLALPKYEQELIKHIDDYATTFKYDDMDLIDQSIFLLGYLEWKVIESPKEVILNEMIEIAKRYSDEWSPKLINGILHKVLSE